MSVVRWLAGLACAVVVLVVGDVASGEIRGRLDRLPFAVLRLARSRLPTELRDRVHDQEWVPELEHVLQHAELFPLTRLVTGLRFAAGLLIRAGAVAAELQPAVALEGGESQDRTWRQRLADRPAAVLRTVLWPAGLTLPLRLYVAAVIMAAGAATTAAAVSAPISARDLELCAVLLCCGLIAHGAPPVARGPLVCDLMGTWLLPAAVLLPPFYALVAPMPLFALDQLRRPGATYRRVFSAAATSLAYGAVSALSHATASPAAGHFVPPGTALLTWLLVIAVGELLATAGTDAAILVAIKVGAPSTRVLPLAANRNALLHELAAITLGTAATLAAAVYPPLAMAIIPAVIVATKRMPGEGPGPAPAS